MTPGCQEKCQDLDDNGSKGEGRNMKPMKGRLSVQEEGDVFIKQAVWWYFGGKKKKGYANMIGSKKSRRVRKSKGWGENQETGKSQIVRRLKSKLPPAPIRKTLTFFLVRHNTTESVLSLRDSWLRKVSKNSSSRLMNECSLSIANFTYFADGNVLKASHIRYQWLPSIV